MKNGYKPLNSFLYFFIVTVVQLLITAEGFAQQTYTWNQTATADWTLPANWTPARNTPAANDILQFNNGATVIITSVPTETIGQLHVILNTSITLQTLSPASVITVNGGVGNDLIVTNGAALNISGNFNDLTLAVATGANGVITGTMNFVGIVTNTEHKLTAADAGGIVFNSPAVFTQGNRCTGNVFGAAGTAGTIIFNSGSTFLQNGGSIPNANPFALGAPASKVIFNAGSLYKHQQNGVPSMAGRTYADFELNYASANLPLTGVTGTNIDNLTVTDGQINLNLTGGVNIKGNISVAATGILGFNATTGSVNLIGSTAQVISNAGVLTFGTNTDVIFNNAAGFILNNSITLNKLVTFSAGVLTIPSPMVLTFSATANVVSVSNTSFVNGSVKRIGNTSFIFPVGDVAGPFSGYVPIGISAPLLITDEYTARYKRASAVAVNNNYAAALSRVSSVDHWSLDRTSGTTTVDVTLYWTNLSSSNGSALFINDLSKLVVAHYNGSTQWDIYGGLANGGSGFAAGSITWAGINLFSANPNLFSLGSTDPVFNLLPVTLNYFRGSKKNQSNILHWKITCDNSDNLTIQVEKSTDNKNFYALKNIAAGGLRCQQPFEYYDAVTVPGIIYYRLKITNAQGKTSFSEAIAFENKDIGFTMAGPFPSAVNNEAVLQITALQSTKMNIVIRDITGKTIKRINCNLLEGGNRIVVNATSFAAGIYYITGYTAYGKTGTVRFIKL